MAQSAHPLVSVLIPSYNAGRWIEATVRSVQEQTWPNIECIIVNDGSTDGSDTLLDHLASARIKIVHQRNRGQTAALNECLRHAQGEYVQYLDADDIIGPKKLELQVNRLKHNCNCIATAEWARFREDPTTAEFVPDATWNDLAPVEWLVANWSQGGGMMYPAMWLLPRRIVETIGPWREDLTVTNDTEYFSRAVLAATAVFHCRGAKTYYRSGLPGSLSGVKSNGAWISQYHVIEICTERIRSHEDSERTRRVSSMLWQRFAHAAYPYAPSMADLAMTVAESLHPMRLPIEGGRSFMVAKALMGWRLARRLQVISGRY